MANEVDAERDTAADSLALSTGEGSPYQGYHASPDEEVKILLNESDSCHNLGYSWPVRKKWVILTVIFVVQCSMNFNASVYWNAVDGLTKRFDITPQFARIGQAVFLIAYAIGCELWAPWSEEFGRRGVLQLSLALVNLFQLPCALARNYNTIIAGRVLGGLSSAGGSVTLGMVADMWKANDQQYAVAFIVFASVSGSILGPIFGGFIQEYHGWQWIFWWQLIFGGVAQALHFFLVPETRPSVILDREAKRLRLAGEQNIYGPNETKAHRLTVKEVVGIWYRPFEMFFTEPIVLCLSLLSGFSDSLIFTFLESYSPVFRQWNFGVVATGLAFVPMLVGYCIAYLSWFPSIRRQQQARETQPRDHDSVQPEARLYWLLWTAPLETIGLFGFAFTSIGPPHVHWIAPLIFSGMIGIANVSARSSRWNDERRLMQVQYAIYMATIDYMMASYGQYSASATGGNGFARDLLAGIAAIYSTPCKSKQVAGNRGVECLGLGFRLYILVTANNGTVYTNVPAFGKLQLVWPTAILGCLAAVVTIPIFMFYRNGPAIRERSKFAQSLALQGPFRDPSRPVSRATGGRRLPDKDV
ncbi:MAG: hypothetical protein Q9168_007783 [Polycauliona sp. 1 TL-2023]